MGNEYPIARAIGVTEHVCDLPSIPTQGWAAGAAQALSSLAPGAVVCTLVAHIARDSQQLNIISTGIATGNGVASEDAEEQARTLYLHDKLERLIKLGIEIPSDAWDRGMVASLRKLNPQWNTLPLGRILATQSLVRPLLMLIPINASKPGLYLLACIAFDAASPETPEPELITTLAGVFPILSHRSQIALSRVSNPKAWLTDREQEILDQLIEGHSVRVIADKLGRSSHTVHDHVKNLHKKIGATSRGELIAKAMGHTRLPRAQTSQTPVIVGADAQLTELKPNQTSTTRPHARPLHAPRLDNR